MLLLVLVLVLLVRVHARVARVGSKYCCFLWSGGEGECWKSHCEVREGLVI